MIFRGSPSADTTVLQRLRARLAQVGEQVASCPLGQILYRGTDRLLWTLETSVQWFVESKEPDDNDSIPEAIPRPRLERPLPWVLFLPLLVCLRLVKMTADVVTCLMGKEPLSPAQVARFLRVRRRRLRAVKYQGLTNFQRWQQTKLDNKQSGKRKTLATDSDSSNEYENLLEKIKRMCHDYTSDDDPDYEPSEDGESYDSESSEEELEANECHPKTVTEANLDNKLPTSERNTVIPTSEPENRIADAANCQTTVATSDAADEQEQAKAETPSSQIHTVITTNSDTVSVSGDDEKHQNGEQDDSSSTLSLDSTEACSESTSQTFYSPVNSSCITPEPKPSAMTQETQLTESAVSLIPDEAESQPVDQLHSLASLPPSTESNNSSITSGSTSSVKDFKEDTKGKSKFSNFFQIRKKSLPQNT